jgi:hypothetical protein
MPRALSLSACDQLSGVSDFVIHDPERLARAGSQPQAKGNVHGLPAEGVRHILQQQPTVPRQRVQGPAESGERFPSETVWQSVHLNMVFRKRRGVF